MDVDAKDSEHCAEPSCMEYGFSPFTCTGCSLKYCFDHSNPTAHDCQGSAITVIVCPVCDQSLKAAPGVDVNVLWMDHSDSTCPGKKPDRKKCPTCLTSLNVANTFRCRGCDKEYCMRHRAEEDHQCVDDHMPQSNARTSEPEVFDIGNDADDMSAGLPSHIDIDHRDSLLRDPKRGKFSRVMLALANLCNFKSRRRSSNRIPFFPNPKSDTQTRA